MPILPMINNMQFSSSGPNATSFDYDDNGFQSDTNNNGIYDGLIKSSIIDDFDLAPSCIAQYESDYINIDNNGLIAWNDIACGNDPA